MPTLNPCPMPTCGAPIDTVHLVPQGMGAFTYVIRCDCGLSFDTGAQSEAAAADRWNERPAPVEAVPPHNCRQRLAAEGKPYPRSSCQSCGQFSPMWRECDAQLSGPPK